MIRKTILITSFAILIAAISVATTMTMVQADPTGDLVDINVPTAVLGADTGITVVVGDEYSSTMTVVDAVVTFTDAGGFDGMIQVGELVITTPGTGIVTGGLFVFTGGATVLFTDGNGNQIVDGGELSVMAAGAAVANGPATLVATSVHPIMVDIDDGTVRIDLTAGSPNTSNIVVTITDIDWLDGATPVPGAIGSFSCSLETGATATPKFDENTLWVSLSNVMIGTTIDINCEFEAFHGDIDKVQTGDCDVAIKEFSFSPCMFTITYSGVRANVIDTVPAEWKVTSITNNGGEVDAELDFIDAGGTDGLVQIGELSVGEEGTNVPNGVFTFAGTGTSAIVTFTDANADKKVQIGELVVTNPGTAVVADGTETLTADTFTNCTFEQSNKKTNNKSSTPITCEDVTDVNSKVNVQTRESPGKGHFKKHGQVLFKPTFCSNGEQLFLNNGAQAILVNGTGHVVFSTFGTPVPIVLDFTDPLEIIVDDVGSSFDCDGELKP